MTIKELKERIKDIPETLELECNIVQTNDYSLWAYPIDSIIDDRAFVLICQ